ncbi:zinc finger protein 583-like [Hyposmocoma kahamanoa]|uniref:zinc finger protein 583-like n=1 Tax=Hyposmocoma kahamanoa TaxID=1477025 RepID=UPI000E6DA075|nr:zinc finger protein 583-like [Hyposmocoma kahamanoa]
MDIVKEEIVDKLLCVSCLCVGRTLHKITDQKIQQFYLDTLNEIPLCNILQSCPSICWECSALLNKAVSFREQVKDSYRILQTYTSENLHECLLTDITRPPRLKLHRNEPIEIIPEYEQPQKYEIHIDNEVQKVEGRQIKRKSFEVNIEDAKPEVQSVFVKEELKDEWDADNSAVNAAHSDDDQTEMSTREIETEIQSLINKKEKKKRKKPIENKMKRTKKIVKSLKTENKVQKQIQKRTNTNDKKIIILELSYEEMLSERAKEAAKESYIRAEYKCETCIMGFNYSRSYKAHIIAKHSANSGEYICPICKTIIATYESFTSHYKRHTRRYECSICHKRTMDFRVMQQHYYSTHEITLKQYTCNICGYNSNSIDSHRYHKDTHKARVQCPECDKTFSHRAGLMNHRLAVHEYNNDFPCTICDKVFKWRTSLKRHLEKHEAKDKQPTPAAHCSSCSISFSSVSSYQRHLKNSLKHVTPADLKYTCDHCKRRFADKTKLRDHIEEKHLHKSFHCHICLKPSKNRVGLDQHIRNVHRGRPNNKMCHHCGKGFPVSRLRQFKHSL